MKKATGQKKIDQPEKSQSSIKSFFSKPHSKLTLKKKPPNEINNIQNDGIAACQSISSGISSKLVENNKKNILLECLIEDKNVTEVINPIISSSKVLDKVSLHKNVIDIGTKKDHKSIHLDKCDINKTDVNMLPKGKHQISDDHCVPNIITDSCPPKKIKLTSPKKASPIKKIKNDLDSKKEMEYCVDFNNIKKLDQTKATCNEDLKNNIDELTINASDAIDGDLESEDLGAFEEDLNEPDRELIKENLNPLESIHLTDDLKEQLDSGCNVDELSDLFDDDWNMNDVDCSEKNSLHDELDLAQWQRCDVLDVVVNRNSKIIKLKESNGAKQGTCSLEGSWCHADIKVGDIVSLIAHKVDTFKICNDFGYLVQWPDTLISGTEIVGSVFCQRKAVLQHRFKGIDVNNKYMVIGSLVHKLFQACLSKGLSDMKGIKSECRTMMKSMECIYMLYEADMSQEMASGEMMEFAPQISHFIEKCVTNDGNQLSGFDRRDSKKRSVTLASEWDGTINRVVDIEENIWSPRLGIKGKIDVTAEVTIYDHKNVCHKKMMPLELKTGKASHSSEHRGQVILYTMLMTAIASGDTKDVEISEGLLLYLRKSIGIHQIMAGRSEKRDLLMLRNQLAYYIANWCKPYMKNNISVRESSKGKDDNVNRIIDEFKYELMELPEPINHHSACALCPYATICSIHLSKDPTIEVSSSNPLKAVMSDSMKHLSSSHVDYFLRFCQLLAMEDGEAFVQNPLKDIWTVEACEREKRGKCLTNMKVDGAVIPLRDRFEHTLRRYKTESNSHLMDDIQLSGFQVGEYIILSTEHQIAVSAGTIIHMDKSIITLLLDRNITQRNPLSTLYYLDFYESQSLNLHNLTNLGVLMDKSIVSSRLRRIVIDKTVATFSDKISRQVLDKGKNILSNLNKVQQRAVLKGISTNNYMLIKGMPGTGKTQTIVALVELLVLLGKSVLITSQTHSAVDNVLIRLQKSSVKILRIGPSGRVHQQLLPFSESVLTKKCKSPEDLESVYMDPNVVGVTCIGAKHALLTKRIFDVCIVDESTQVLQCTVLKALFASRKFILVGDPEQLPPIVRSKSARLLGLTESLFDRLDCAESTVNLNLQYRMNEPIMNLANWFTYKGELQCANDTVRMANIPVKSQEELLSTSEAWLEPCISAELKNSVVIIDTGNSAGLLRQYGNGSHSQGKKTYNNRHKIENVCEAALVANIITKLLKIGVKSEEIGVIAPFRDQVALLQKVISKLINNLKTDTTNDNPQTSESKECDINKSRIIDIEVNTVDQYQGRDKQVIIYSCTKTWNLEKNQLQEFSETDILNDKRRLTVAITRAKNKLIMIGDVATLKFYKPFKELFREVDLRKNTTEEVSFVDLKLRNEFRWEDVMGILSQDC